MTRLELKNHPVWQDLTEVLENLDAKALVTEHLKLCNYKICGYWDENDEFYEEITLHSSLSAQLASTSIGVTGTKRWIQLKFMLKSDRIASQNLSNTQPTDIGELTLIYNQNMQFIDENWQIDIKSPLIIAKHQ